MSAGVIAIIPVHGMKKQRRCPVVPWPAWWDEMQNQAGVWDSGAHRPADLPGSTDSGTDPSETAPSSAPTGKSSIGEDGESEKYGFVIMKHFAD